MSQRKESSGEKIAHLAYELYIERGGDHGRDVEDWLKATAELSVRPAGESEAMKAAHEAASVRAALRWAWPE